MNKIEKLIKDSLNSSVSHEEPSEELKKNVFSVLDKGTNRQRKHNFKYKVATVAAAIVIFITSVNVSPAFADQLRKIPLASELVKLIRFDKGLQQLVEKDKGIFEAIKNSYIENSNITVKDNGISFTLENVITDSKRMLITYSVKYDETINKKVDSLWFNNLLVTGDGKKLVEIKNGIPADNGPDGKFVARNIVGPGELDKAGVPVSSDIKDNKDKLFGWIEIMKQDDKISFPETIKFDINGFKDSFLENAKVYPGNWSLDFDIPEKYRNVQPIMLKQQNFNISAGKYNIDFSFENGKVYPTVTTIKLKVLDFKNSPQRLSLNMHLEDENGNIYNKTEDEYVTNLGITEPEFTSSYFTNPKQLYLVIESIVDPATKTVQDINQKMRIY
jgi:hypothetical protein